MKTYKAHLIAVGEGCDYSIGCGETVKGIKASSLKEAQEKLISEIKENYPKGDNCELSIVKLYEIENIVNIDMKKIYDDFDDEKEEIKNKEKEEAERKEFERLKKKFNK
jgi:hypothetical protein